MPDKVTRNIEKGVIVTRTFYLLTRRHRVTQELGPNLRDITPSQNQHCLPRNHVYYHASLKSRPRLSEIPQIPLWKASAEAGVV